MDGIACIVVIGDIVQKDKGIAVMGGGKCIRKLYVGNKVQEDAVFIVLLKGRCAGS